MVHVADMVLVLVQFANKQHASLRESVARLESTGVLEGLGSSPRDPKQPSSRERAILRQILGLEIASELAVVKHPTDRAFLAQVQHDCICHFSSQSIVVYSCANDI